MSAYCSVHKGVLRRWCSEECRVPCHPNLLVGRIQTSKPQEPVQHVARLPGFLPGSQQGCFVYCCLKKLWRNCCSFHRKQSFLGWFLFNLKCIFAMLKWCFPIFIACTSTVILPALVGNCEIIRHCLTELHLVLWLRNPSFICTWSLTPTKISLKQSLQCYFYNNH